MIKDIHREDFENANAPVAAEGGQVESHEVRRLDEGVCNMEGPIVVGGRRGADCFWGETQAGQPDPPYTLELTVGTEHTPRTRPW